MRSRDRGVPYIFGVVGRILPLWLVIASFHPAAGVEPQSCRLGVPHNISIDTYRTATDVKAEATFAAGTLTERLCIMEESQGRYKIYLRNRTVWIPTFQMRTTAVPFRAPAPPGPTKPPAAGVLAQGLARPAVSGFIAPVSSSRKSGADSNSGHRQSNCIDRAHAGRADVGHGSAAGLLAARRCRRKSPPD